MSQAWGPTMNDAERLVQEVASYGSCAVALSGGVDSAVVAMAARLALGDQAVAVTGVGPALAGAELDAAREVAAQIGIRHVERVTHEAQRPGYIANAPDRCFYCKTELYEHLADVAAELGLATLVSGANADDLGDHRPGLRAADDAKVRSPLAELGLNKRAVRDLAAHWGLRVADKPAAPCLASRIAYGVQVTPDRLRRIEHAERLLHGLGLREVRVRLHEGELARVEAPLEHVARLAEPGVRDQLVEGLERLGFKYVTLDLAGFRSGSLNRVLPMAELSPWVQAPRGERNP